MCRDLFMSLANIYDGGFCENSYGFLTVNFLSANRTKWPNTLEQLSAVADELFECV